MKRAQHRMLQELVGSGHADDVTLDTIVAAYEKRHYLRPDTDAASGRVGGAMRMLNGLRRDGWVDGTKVTRAARRLL